MTHDHTQPSRVEEVVDLDPARTDWYDEFFSRFGGESPVETLASVSAIGLDDPPPAASRDLARYALSGWAYWVLFLQGYLEYLGTGSVDEANPYFRYMATAFGPQGHDPGLGAALEDPNFVADLVARRYRDCRVLQLGEADGGTASADSVDPLIVWLSDRPSATAKHVYPAGSGTPLVVREIDGYHRLFAARLFGVQRLRCHVITNGARRAAATSGEQAL